MSSLRHLQVAVLAVPLVLGLHLHFEAGQVRYIGAPVAADDTAAVVANEAVLVPLARVVGPTFVRAALVADLRAHHFAGRLGACPLRLHLPGLGHTLRFLFTVRLTFGGDEIFYEFAPSSRGLTHSNSLLGRWIRLALVTRLAGCGLLSLLSLALRELLAGLRENLQTQTNCKVVAFRRLAQVASPGLS